MKIVDDTSLNLRLRIIRKTFGLSQEEFGKSLNLKKSAICTYENGQRTPRESTIDLICDMYNVNPDYLKYGNKPVFTSELQPFEMISILSKKYDLKELDKEILYNYLKLSPEQKSAIKQYLETDVKREG